jgi:hypothetical protein
VAERAVGIGARQNQQHTRLAGHRAPGLDAVEYPAAIALRRLEPHCSDIGAGIRFGDGNGTQRIAHRDLGQPLLPLLFGSSLEQRAAEDFRAGDEAACGAERAARELLGDHDHPHVVFMIVALDAAVALGNRQAEAAHLGQRLENLLRNDPVLAMDLLGQRHHHVGRQLAERILHHRLVVPEHVGAAGAVQRDDLLPSASRLAASSCVWQKRLRPVRPEPPGRLAETETLRPRAQAVVDVLQRLGAEGQRHPLFQAGAIALRQRAQRPCRRIRPRNALQVASAAHQARSKLAIWCSSSLSFETVAAAALLLHPGQRFPDQPRRLIRDTATRLHPAVDLSHGTSLSLRGPGSVLTSGSGY